MDVKAQIKILVVLQGYDKQIIALNAKLKELPARLDEISRDVTQLQEVVDRELGELAQEDSWKAEKEEEHTFIEAQIGRLRKQLQDARAHKEALALQRQLDASRKQSADLEEELLQTMQAVDARRAAVGDHEASLKVFKKQLAKEEGIIKSEMEEVEAEVAALTAERDEHSKALDSSVHKRYATLATRRHPSIVEAIDGHCTGCNMALQPQLYNTLFHANSMEVCPQCMRMIYKRDVIFGDEPESGEQESSEPKSDE